MGDGAQRNTGNTEGSGNPYIHTDEETGDGIHLRVDNAGTADRTDRSILQFPCSGIPGGILRGGRK